SALHRPKGRAAPDRHRRRDYELLGTGDRVLHLQLASIRSGPQLWILRDRLRGGDLEQREDVRIAAAGRGRLLGAEWPPESGLPAPVQGRLLPRPAHG